MLEFQATGRPPLLWLSERALYTPGKAIRGGIPLCFPWFGPHPGDPAKPAHGFARNRNWQLASASNNDGSHTLVFQLQDDADTRALWPHAFLAELHMEFGRELRLTLVVKNTGPQDFSFSFAFHSYFPVTDIAQARVEGLDGSRCIDQLASTRTPFVHSGPIAFQGETDRIYLGANGNYRITDSAAARQTIIQAGNCHSAIVWNPWQEKTARLGDMQAEGWRRMLCVECGNVETDTLALAAGQSLRCALHIND